MSKIKTNILYNVIYQILILIVPLITTPYVSRVLLPEGVGTYSITTAIAKYFFMFAMLGMSKHGNRSVAKVKDDKKKLSVTFWNLFYFQLIMSVVSLFIYIVYIYFWGYEQYGIVIICQIPYVISALIEISWFFYGTENFKFIVTRNVIVKVLTAVSVFAFVKESDDVWIYVLINSISLFAGQLCLWPFLKKHVDFEKPNKELIKSHLKPNCILFVSVVAVSIYTLMDKIMIEILSNTTELGYYENSHKIIDVCCNIIGAVGTVMLPRVAFLMEKNDNKTTNYYIEKSMNYIMMIAIAIGFGMAGIGKEFAIVYFGKEFTQSGLVMMAIAPGIIFFSWGNILRTQYLIPGNRDNIFVKGTIYASITNVVLNLLLINKLGAIGAAIGTVGAWIIEALYESAKVYKELDIKKYLKNIIPFVIFGIIMFIYCRIIARIGMKLTISICTEIIGGAIIYLILSLSYLIINKDRLVLDIIEKLKTIRIIRA